MKYNEKEKCLKLTDKELQDCYKHISRAIYPTLERFAKERKSDDFDIIAWTFKEIATSQSSPKNIIKDLIHGVIRPSVAEARFKKYISNGEAEYMSNNPKEIDDTTFALLDKMYEQQIDLGLYLFRKEFRNMWF
jgi:hypothetical protein